MIASFYFNAMVFLQHVSSASYFNFIFSRYSYTIIYQIILLTQDKSIRFEK